ncbi:hypothetical protein Veis_4232 [Verminephrobacter eiseniae EF01-2]|uniref:Uncharacterized protein n=1 Tax=Verminephrobacter eiseniae (strain EF01-2) TaxID=391735 RepID=A1WQN0_VEREI|nr:hypothetical protein Veis_4232 [Verminephrobacter eiseniae EF01-2]
MCRKVCGADKAPFQMPRTISPSAMRQRCRMAMKGAARWRNGAMAQWDAVRAGPRPVAPFLRPSPCGSGLCRFMRCYGGLQGLGRRAGAGQPNAIGRGITHRLCRWFSESAGHRTPAARDSSVI